jgi:hypothetical protein
MLMRVLDSSESAEFVKGIAVVARHIVVQGVNKAVGFAKKHGFPVVLKALSQKIIHKTEAGAVRIVHSKEQLEKEFIALKKIAPRILVQEFVKGNEFILGLKKDPVFGHVVVAGIGGIYVEVYKDVQFRICPIKRDDAEGMLDDLQGKNIFIARGKKLNRKLLINALVRLSQLPGKKSRISELDINPFILNEREGKIVDARVVLD